MNLEQYTALTGDTKLAAADLDKSSAALINCHYRYEDAVAVNKVLVDALKDTAQTLAWQQLGECRGFSERLLPTIDCLNKVKKALKLAGVLNENYIKQNQSQVSM